MGSALSSNPEPRVVIIGGGYAGITVARLLNDVADVSAACRSEVIEAVARSCDPPHTALLYPVWRHFTNRGSPIGVSFPSCLQVRLVERKEVMVHTLAGLRALTDPDNWIHRMLIPYTSLLSRCVRVNSYESISYNEAFCMSRQPPDSHCKAFYANELATRSEPSRSASQ
jgi:hypothetical protein